MRTHSTWRDTRQTEPKATDRVLNNRNHGYSWQSCGIGGAKAISSSIPTWIWRNNHLTDFHPSLPWHRLPTLISSLASIFTLSPACWPQYKFVSRKGKRECIRSIVLNVSAHTLVTPSLAYSSIHVVCRWHQCNGGAIIIYRVRCDHKSTFSFFNFINLNGETKGHVVAVAVVLNPLTVEHMCAAHTHTHTLTHVLIIMLFGCSWNGCVYLMHTTIDRT